MLIILQWLLGIALWLLWVCQAVRIELRLTLVQQSQIQIRRMGCSYITPGSWNLSGRRSRLGCYIINSPMFWIRRLGEEDALAAAINLQWDAGVMLSNLQVIGQFVISLHRMSSEMLNDAGDGTCGVPFGGGHGSVYCAAGASGGPVHGRDGFMASSD